MTSGKSAKETAVRVSVVGMVGNILLTLFKLVAGIVGNSGAMISDAVHSASDVFSGLIVIVGVHFSSKESDPEHPYGHERFECVAAIVLSVLLLLAGGTIGIAAVQNIATGEYERSSVIGWLALIAAVTSVVVKEAMFWYTKINAKRINSPALNAEAWHHRSDALSSVGAIIGIGGTFNFIAGRVKRAPKWVQRSGLEWIYRIIQEPARLWRRYAYGLVKFSWLSLLSVFGAYGKCKERRDSK